MGLRATTEFNSTFPFQGWKIKYDLLQSKAGAVAKAKTVVFIHGTPWSSEVFRPITKALLAKDEYQLLLYDLPGYGQSQELQSSGPKDSGSQFEGDTSVKFQALALTELLKHLGLNTEPGPAVIAHDIAGTIALRAHLLHACQFRSLLLLDTNTVLPWGDGFYKLVRSEPGVFLKLPSNIFEGVVREVIRSACANPAVLASGWEDRLAQPWIASQLEHDMSTGRSETKRQAEAKQASFVRQIAQANDADVAEMLDQNMYQRVQCPVKILWGEDDKWIPREKMESLASLLGHCLEEFVVIPDAGHLIMLDQPERVTFEVVDWLSRN